MLKDIINFHSTILKGAHLCIVDMRVKMSIVRIVYMRIDNIIEILAKLVEKHVMVTMVTL